MPKVIITRSWPDDGALQVIVKVRSSFPDVLAEAKRVALDTFTEALAEVVVPVVEP